ncbi:MAG: sulfotransferase [Phycisphaerales bacterium]|nr:sulfotransferase [Phycisphaerales bacterium]
MANIAQLLKKAEQYLRRGDSAQAESAYRSVLRKQPRNGEVLCSLSTIALRTGRVRDAADLARKATAVAPTRIDAYHALIAALSQTGTPAEVIDEIHRRVQAQPKWAAGLTLLGGLQLNNHDLADAEQTYRRALAADADHVDAASGLALVLERLGRHDEAGRALDPHLSADPPDPGIIWAYGRVAPHMGDRIDAIDRIETLLRSDLTPLQRNQLCYMMAKLCDAEGRYDEAFRYAGQANAIGRVPDASDRIEQTVDSHITTFSRDRLASLPRASIWSELPVLIVGMPRSGTSLVEQILASHPCVHGAGELDDVRLIAKSLPRRLRSDGGYPACVQHVTPSILDDISRSHLDQLAQLSPDSTRITDKFPENYLHLGLIALLFPQARIIHCTRHPLDTCLSCYFEDFGPRHQYSRSLSSLGRQYLQYQRLMAHWHTVLDLPILDVAYEDVVADLDGAARQLIDFAGLAWDDACLRFHETQRVVRTLSYDQVRQPIYTKSVGRYRNYEAHLQPLIEAIAGERA